MYLLDFRDFKILVHRLIVRYLILNEKLNLINVMTKVYNILKF